MTNLSSEFCSKIKEARRQAKLGQTVVAKKVGCKQTALSMFENGGVTKLNDEVIEKLSKLFNVAIITVDSNNYSEQKTDLQALQEEANAAQEILIQTKGFCPNPHCPSNHYYEVDGRHFIKPDRQTADPVGRKFCAVCGEILEKRCPNCGAPIHDGAICSYCGDPYITV